MNRSLLYSALVVAMATAACGDAGDKDGGGYQGVHMDESEGVGTVTGSETDPYGSAAIGAVGTDEAPPVVTGDGREGPDTTYQADGAGVPDTMR